MSTTWTDLFGDELLTKDGVQPTTKVLADKKVVGIYFSAHWCPPCRAFTPVLTQTYDELKEEHPDLEIVFVSSDREESAFAGYYSEMSFTALPYVQRDKKSELAAKYEVKSIPTLVFLNDKGELIEREGRHFIAGAEGDIEKIWSHLTAQK
jgi:nucleoredoxin|uniref:Thioredoxin domain-containing protein n=1 Tax=Globisporangium ultimum (strain ATCC 200006 / CBS 805.95 / DAOM BR144) TaxID=431595 RepID=K3WGP5_GLOUD